MSLYVLGSVLVAPDDVRAEDVPELPFPRQGIAGFRRGSNVEIWQRPDTRFSLREHYPDLADLESRPVDEDAVDAWAGFEPGEIEALKEDDLDDEDVVGHAARHALVHGASIGRGGGHGARGNDDALMDFVGRGGGGGGRGRRGPRGPRSGVYPYWIGPGYYDGYEIDDDLDDEAIDAFADEIADRVAVRVADKEVGGNAAVDFISDVTSTADYDNGQKLAIQANQFFVALGRPSEFEPAMQAVWAAYEKARLGWLGESFMTAKQYYGTQMKQVGADAARLMSEMQRAYPSKASVVASTLNTDVYNPRKDEPGKIPWWVWLIAGTIVFGGVAYFAAPVVAAAIARRGALRLATGR